MTSVPGLDLATAQALSAAALGAAGEREVLVSVAVVDSGGHLVAFARMDGAEIAGTVLAPDKAYTAVANSAATHELARAAAPGGPLFGLHTAARGRYVIFGGGIPLRGPDRAIVGAVGVSGAPDPADDVACAERAVARWEALRDARQAAVGAECAVDPVVSSRDGLGAAHHGGGPGTGRRGGPPS